MQLARRRRRHARTASAAMASGELERVEETQGELSTRNQRRRHPSTRRDGGETEFVPSAATQGTQLYESLHERMSTDWFGLDQRSTSLANDRESALCGRTMQERTSTSRATVTSLAACVSPGSAERHSPRMVIVCLVEPPSLTSGLPSTRAQGPILQSSATIECSTQEFFCRGQRVASFVDAPPDGRCRE